MPRYPNKSASKLDENHTGNGSIAGKPGSGDTPATVKRKPGRPKKVLDVDTDLDEAQVAAAKLGSSRGSWTDDPGRAAKNAGHLAGMEDESNVVRVSKPIVLPRLDIRTLEIRLVGDSPLICHKWSEKAIKQMLDKQMGRATEGRGLKDPERDFRESLYPYPGGGYGFPSIAFKNAAVSACTSLGKAVTKVAARQSHHVIGELVKINGKPNMREDMVRVGQGTADIRYRGEFKEWDCVISIRYNARVLSDEQIVNLFNTAGFAVGIGEWRPERDGAFGMFHVE